MSSKKEKAATGTWLEVAAPDYLGGKVIGTIVVSPEDEALGRKVEILQSDLTEDPAHSFTKIVLKVVDASGNKAQTTYWGHEISRDYIRSILRKGSSRVGQVLDAETKDGYKLRLTVTAVSRHKISTKKKTFLSNKIAELIKQRCSSLKLSQLVQEMLSGKTESDLFNFAKRHMMVKFTSVTKVKMLRVPVPLKSDVPA